jgi:cysteine desulfurase / selenocysteine lyase
MSRLDVAALREEFPILAAEVHGAPLVYLDNAATTQKPQAVIDRVARYYTEENANVHRAVHALAERATDAYEHARATVARFFNAAHPHEIVFVRGTTEAINLVADSFGGLHVHAGDEVLVSVMEHHSNIVPWQVLCARAGANLRVVSMTDEGELRASDVADALTARTRIVSIAHVSNVLGSVNPVRDIVRLAHERGAAVIVDGAQAAGHLPVDVQALGCDFYAASGHKMFGPTGIGVLYGRAEHLESMPPYQSGGGMVGSVSFEGTSYAPPPYRFEAGTPDVAGAVGLAAAVAFLERIDPAEIEAHEADLCAHAAAALGTVRGLRLVGTAPRRIGVLSFVLEGVHPHDVATMLDRIGVAIRAGHHCCQPLMDRLALPGTARASIAFYNTREEIDTFVAALAGVREFFA